MLVSVMQSPIRGASDNSPSVLHGQNEALQQSNLSFLTLSVTKG